MTINRDRQEQVPIAIALITVGAGVVLGMPALVVAALIPLGYTAYGSITRVQPVDELLEFERTIDPATAPPGEKSSVTLTVENTGERSITDLRIADGVPNELAVIEGTSQLGTTLRPGETASVQYTIRLRHGSFRFDPVTVRVRSISATTAYTTRCETGGAQEVSSSIVIEEWPRSHRPTAVGDRTTGADAGRGIAFHKTREYQPGDPISRIDWRRYAKDGQLTTVEFAEAGKPDWILLIDARTHNDIAPAATEATGTERAVHCAAVAHKVLQSGDIKVGGLILDGDQPTTVTPGTGRDTKIRMQTLLDQAGSATAGDSSVSAINQAIQQLETTLSGTPRTLVFTPALDRQAVETVEMLCRLGWTVDVIIPDVIGTGSPTRQVTAAKRHLFLAEMQAVGANTRVWFANEPPTSVLREVIG